MWLQVSEAILLFISVIRDYKRGFSDIKGINQTHDRRETLPYRRNRPG